MGEVCLPVTFAFVLLACSYLPGYDRGSASWYGTEQLRRNHHHATANGERYDPRKMTAASNRYALGTVLEVTGSNSKRKV